MGEYIGTSIKLGGKLKATKVDDLIATLKVYNFCVSPDEEAPEPTNLDELFYANEVNYGQIDSVIRFCVDNRLDYEHWTDACAGTSESVTRSIGGVLEALDYADGEPVIPLKRILAIETLATGMGDLIALAKRWATPLKLEIVP